MKVAIYCRLSEEDRNKQNKSDDSNSIKNQKTMLIQYALDHDWEVFDIYSDDDYTGADRNRPQFQRLLTDAEARKFDIILCKTQSRFTRELELVEKYIHGLFPIWGIRFISIVDNADTANKGNKKSRQINGLVNEWYLEDMSDNIRSVLTSRRENGFHIGAFAPYGYSKDPERRGHLIVDPEAAEVVKEIFSLFADGLGKSGIAKRLNNRGVPNPSEYKRLKGFKYTQPKKNIGRMWSYRTVQGILVNEVYIGNLIQGKQESISYKTKQLRDRPKEKWIRVNNTHEPIISKEVWDQVQSKVNAHYRPFLSTSRIHPLSGKVFCIYCGASMHIHTQQTRRYLQCHTRNVSDTECPGAFMPAAELEKLIIVELRKFTQELLDHDKLEQEVEYHAGLNLKRKTEQLIEARKSLEEKRQEYGTAMKQLYIDKLRGIITVKDYTEISKQFTREKRRMDEEIRSCDKRLTEVEARKMIGDNRLERIQGYLSLSELTRPMTEALIGRIEIGKRDKETGKVPVSIFWNF